MPSSSAPSTVSNSASSPAAWPSVRLQAPLLGPPAVAVHDAGDVGGDPLRVDAVELHGSQPTLSARGPDRPFRNTQTAPGPRDGGPGSTGPGRLGAVRRGKRRLIASGVTFAVFLSLFPLILLVTAVVGYLAVDDPHVAQNIIDALGLTGSAAKSMSDAVDNASRARQAATVIGFVGLVWAATGVTTALQRG